MRNCRAFDARLGRERRGSLERLDELRPAIGISRIVERIDADEDVVRAQHFRPRQRQRQHHRVARGHVGRRDGIRIGSALRHLAVAEQRRSAERREIDRKLAMRFRAERLGNLARRQNLVGVPLAVLDRQRVDVEAGLARERCRGVGVEPAAQQHDGFARRRGHSHPRCVCGSAAEAGRAGDPRESTPTRSFGSSTPCTGENSTAAHRRSSACRVTMSRANS